MKLIIAGGRDMKVTKHFINALFDFFNIFPKEIVSGGCRGIDKCGEFYSKHILQKQPTIFDAKWNTHGKKAGPMRNEEMAKYADALLLIWSGEASGSNDMKEQMKKVGKPVYECVLKKVTSG